MRKIILALFSFCLILPIAAQQQKADVRSHTIFAFPEFKEAKVLQPFGRFTKAKANILLKNGINVKICANANNTCS